MQPDCGTDLETLRDFTSVSSDFYPELGSHYREAIEEWYLTRERPQRTVSVTPSALPSYIDSMGV
jgi:hypothetical protein